MPRSLSDFIPKDAVTEIPTQEGHSRMPAAAPATQGVQQKNPPGPRSLASFIPEDHVDPETDDQNGGLIDWAMRNIEGVDSIMQGWYSTRADSKRTARIVQEEAGRDVTGDGGILEQEKEFERLAREAQDLDTGESTTLIPDNPITGEVTVRDALTGLGNVAGFARSPAARIGGVYKQMREAGVDDQTARRTSIVVGTGLAAVEGMGLGAAGGATGAAVTRGTKKAAERIGLGGVIRSVDKAPAAAKRAAAIGAAYAEAFAAEGTQEVVEQLVTNTAIAVVDDENDTINRELLKKITAGAGRSFGVGGVTGGFVRAGKTPADIRNVVRDMRENGEISKETESVMGEVLEAMDFTPPSQSSFSFMSDRATDKALDQAVYAGAETAKIGRGGVQKVKKTFDWWHEPMIIGLEDSPVLAVKMVGRGLRKAADTQRRIRGRLQPQADKVANMTAGIGKGKAKLYRELIQEEVNERGFGDSMYMQAVEDDAVMAKLSDRAQEVVREQRKLSEQVAEIARELGVKLTMNDGQQVDFQGIEGGRRLSRHFRKDFHRIVNEGGLPAMKLAKELAFRNGLTPDFALKQLQALTSLANTKEIGVEHARVFPDFPTSMLVNGRRVQLIDADPINSPLATLNSLSGRLAMIAQFGQDPRNLAMIEQDVGEAGGIEWRQQVNDAFRLMHGLPTDHQLASEVVSSDEDSFVRAADTFISVTSSAALSLSAVLNLFETLATLPFSAGFKAYAKGLAEWAADGIKARKAGKSRLEYVDAEKHAMLSAATTTDILNWRADPREAHKTVQRLARNVLVGVATKVNDMNENINAYAGLKWVESMQQGNLDLGDRMRLEFLKFRPVDIRRIMAGRVKAGDPLWTDIVGRAVETGQGTTSVPIEKSRAANNRQWNRWVRFDSYPQKQWNRMSRVYQELNQAFEPLTKNFSATNPIAVGRGVGQLEAKRAGIALKNTAAALMGNAAAGTGALFLRTLIARGDTEDLQEEFENDKLAFMKDAAMYTMFGGAAQQVWEVLTGERDFDQNSVFAGNVVSNLIDMISGEGVYAEAGGLEKGDIFLKRFLPVYRSAGTLAAVVGLGNPNNPRLDSARRAHYNWLRRNVGKIRFDRQEAEDPGEWIRNSEAARKKVAKAYAWMRQGKNPEDIMGKLKEAASLGTTNVSQSLKSRKWANSIPSHLRQQYMEDMGEEHMNVLRAHDRLIEGWAGGNPSELEL